MTTKSVLTTLLDQLPPSIPEGAQDMTVTVELPPGDIERSLAARGRRIYVDYLQNSRGKTLASAYSARASEFAGVSAPLTWDEVEHGVSPQDFTVRTFAARIDQAGDLWAAPRKAKPADLRAVDQFTR